MYTVPSKKDGSPRNTTLRDAREMGLLPSVTTVLGVASKPALIQWMQQQVLMASLTLPRNPNESESDFIDRIMRDSKEQGKRAADAGTDIHAAIESHYIGQPTGKHPEHVNSVKNALITHFGDQKWVAERSFAHSLGFAGKVDLHCDMVVVDVKSKEFDDPDSVKGYEEHMIQLSAYKVGLGLPSNARCANVFVSRSVPGLVQVIEWSPQDIERGWQMFQHLLAFWYLRTGL